MEVTEAGFVYSLAADKGSFVIHWHQTKSDLRRHAPPSHVDAVTTTHQPLYEVHFSCLRRQAEDRYDSQLFVRRLHSTWKVTWESWRDTGGFLKPVLTKRAQYEDKVEESTPRLSPIAVGGQSLTAHVFSVDLLLSARRRRGEDGKLVVCSISVHRKIGANLRKSLEKKIAHQPHQMDPLSLSPQKGKKVEKVHRRRRPRPRGLILCCFCRPRLGLIVLCLADLVGTSFYLLYTFMSVREGRGGQLIE